tara:strand:+ start:175 stop:558 length:384 start_codon:yes stop_codon:yes gene_type:complete
MVGAAIKGISKILKKSKVKRPRGKPTKAGLMARRNMLRGATTTEKYKKTMGDPGKQLKKPKKPGYESGLKEGMITGALVGGTGMYMASKDSKTRKDAKAKTKEAADKHREADKKKKEKRRKYGKAQA